MEMIVIYNMGKDDAQAGKARIAPDYVDYFGYRGKLDAYAKRQWLRGWDAVLPRDREDTRKEDWHYAD